MLMLIKYVDPAREPRFLTKRSACKLLTFERRMIAGARALELAIPRFSDPKHLVKILGLAAEHLRAEPRAFRTIEARGAPRIGGSAARAIEAVCSDASLAAELSSRGIATPDLRPLERALWPRTALLTLEALGAKSAAIAAQRPSSEVEAAAALLSTRVRDLCVYLERDADVFAERFLYTYGVPLRTDLAALRLAEVKLIFSRLQLPIGRGVAVGEATRSAGLRVARPAKLCYPSGVAASGYPPFELASALYTRGLLRADEIAIEGVQITNSIDNSIF